VVSSGVADSLGSGVPLGDASLELWPPEDWEDCADWLVGAVVSDWAPPRPCEVSRWLAPHPRSGTTTRMTRKGRTERHRDGWGRCMPTGMSSPARSNSSLGY
jgi:hypothetical protein